MFLQNSATFIASLILIDNPDANKINMTAALMNLHLVLIVNCKALQYKITKSGKETIPREGREIDEVIMQWKYHAVNGINIFLILFRTFVISSKKFLYQAT